MNKTELKNFAINTRRELLKQVSLRTNLFGITEKTGLKIEEQFGQLIINGISYPTYMKSAFRSLQKQLESKGYEQLLEEVAYTWFNRIIAIRYMEVHDYLPERVNVLSNNAGLIDPDILTEYETLELPVDKFKVKSLMESGDIEGAYRLLFIAQCNALNEILPFMFEKIQDYTELLLPDYLLDKESIINKLIKNDKVTESFENVEVIGWLYQYYNTEPKDQVFANLKKNKKVEKYDIPAATQIFTPRWIVQYMVENTLGQLWMEAYPNSSLKDKMKYYIEPAKRASQTNENFRYKDINIEEIKIIDPCVGSGHMLIYAFDLLYDMYEELGYPSREISGLILTNNLFGLDIDDRAAQLSSFVLCMVARSRNRSFFRSKIKTNIFSYRESNSLEKNNIFELLTTESEELQNSNELIEIFRDSKNKGSIIKVPDINYVDYIKKIESMENIQLSLDNYEKYIPLQELLEILKIANILNQKYDVVVTNPPYIARKNMNKSLNNYVTSNFICPEDFISIFIEVGFNLLKKGGFSSIISTESWMFLSTFEKIREYLINSKQTLSILHLDISQMISFSTVSVIWRNLMPDMNNKTNFMYMDNKNMDGEIPSVYPTTNHRNKQIHMSRFNEYPNKVFAYWSPEPLEQAFKNRPIRDYYKFDSGIKTGKNEWFLRLWHEVSPSKISFNPTSLDDLYQYKWFKYNKGGGYRKWYGTSEYVVNLENEAADIKSKISKNTYRLRNRNNYFKKSITWPLVGGNIFSCKYSNTDTLNDVTANAIYFESDIDYMLLAFLNSNSANTIINILNPTVSYPIDTISQIPLIKSEDNYIKNLAKANVEISREDWDSYETSWGFKKHPFLNYTNQSFLLDEIFDLWCSTLKSRIQQLLENEEIINEYFIKLFGLQVELKNTVNPSTLTLRKENKKNDAKSFLSYFIGCVFGRYSLFKDGITSFDNLTKEGLNNNNFLDKQGLIQFTDKEYFQHDIISRLRKFLSVAFSMDTVNENMQWLANALEIKQGENAEARLRRYFIDEFFADHCKAYQKCPIYWLVDSGKQKGMRTLVYMHRYQPDTMATIRFEHLQEIQTKYNHEIDGIDMRLVNPNLNSLEKRNLDKQKIVFKKRLEELLEFDKKLAKYANIQKSIDLDDGVGVNYAKFNEVLARIK